MKRILKLFGVLSLLATISVACNKELDLTSNGDEESNTSVKTKSTDYYWYDGKKIFLTQVENRSFIIYRISDKSSLRASLNKRGVDLDSSKAHEYRLGALKPYGNASDSFSNCEWAEVEINYKTALVIPEVIYATPFYSSNGRSFPLTNLVYVSFNGYSELFLLEKLAKEYNVEIIGQIITQTDAFILFVVACTKDSKGNALEVSNWLYESGVFRFTDPGFMSATGC